QETERLALIEAERNNLRAEVQERSQREYSLTSQIKAFENDREAHAGRLAEVQAQAQRAEDEFNAAVRAFEQANADYERRLAEYEAKRSEMHAREHEQTEKAQLLARELEELVARDAS